MAHTYGYARTSSKDQHEDRQIIALNSLASTRSSSISKAARTSTVLSIKNCCANLKPATLSLSKALTDSAETTLKFSNNGASSPKTNARLSSFLTLLFSTLVNVRILSALLSPTLSFRLCQLSLSLNMTLSSNVKPKVLPLPKPVVSSSGGNLCPSPITMTTLLPCGKTAKFPVVRPLNFSASLTSLLSAGFATTPTSNLAV